MPPTGAQAAKNGAGKSRASGGWTISSTRHKTGRQETTESTETLLERVSEGDARAREDLIRRYLPGLQRWAHGRLPLRARDIHDTDDLVQITLLRALTNVKTFKPVHKQGFLAYLRRILMNQIVDLVRRAERRPTAEFNEELHRTPEPSQLVHLLGKEALSRYEAAFIRLPTDKQEAIMMRMELGFPYQKIANTQGLSSANAARMKVTRALVHLADVMDGD